MLIISISRCVDPLGVVVAATQDPEGVLTWMCASPAASMACIGSTGDFKQHGAVLSQAVNDAHTIHELRLDMVRTAQDLLQVAR